MTSLPRYDEIQDHQSVSQDIDPIAIMRSIERCCRDLTAEYEIVVHCNVQRNLMGYAGMSLGYVQDGSKVGVVEEPISLRGSVGHFLGALVSGLHFAGKTGPTVLIKWRQGAISMDFGNCPEDHPGYEAAVQSTMPRRNHLRLVKG